MIDVSNQRVGFVGLGDQGDPMALAIVEAGFLLHAWARRPTTWYGLRVVDAFEEIWFVWLGSLHAHATLKE